MERTEGRHGRSGCRVVVVGRANSGRRTIVDLLMVQRGSGADWVRRTPTFELLYISLLLLLLLQAHTPNAWQTSLEQVQAEFERGEHDSRGRPVEKLSIVDVSGHKDFVKNLVVGTSQTDLVLLFVSATEGEFEAGLAEVR
jgi:translation elongation factor EF-1alpha